MAVSIRSRTDPPVISIDEQVVSLEGHPEPASYAYRLVLKALFERIEGFILLHAGVVGKKGRALILSGPPGSGKSTLILSLLKKGFLFYSDDVCPIHRQSGRVHPFPRSLWAEPDERTAVRNGVESGFREGKVPVDLDEIRVSVGDKPYGPACLICLDPGEETEPLCELRLALKEKRNEEVLDDLGRIEGLSLESMSSGYAEWRLLYPKNRGLTPEIRHLLDKHKDRIWDVYREDAVKPDFTRHPILEPISVDEAVFHLLRDLKQGFPFQTRPGLSRESPGKLFISLSDLVGKAACYRLRVGGLNDMKKLVLEAFRSAR